ncbi:transcriptional regulator [Rhodococcus spongiicola]|uniref:Transcriptional regulator n=1 Tax=Rhodococcus spongiicola TaxID=2487352 RepID=A0A3S3E2E4_9NOCA|nr:transcriptional regulator [Rhodococcus spongiicola]RVW03783.1 transcriptional regulator [Rhodococcus spongiicola]
MARTSRHSRPALIVLVVVAAGGCLALGWWQWTRFESVGGNGQNLGYALQWPLFAAFVIYAYRRFVQLEDDREQDDADGPAAGAATDQPTDVPEGLLPERPKVESVTTAEDLEDPEARQMLEYNDYLAELSAREPDRSDK